MTNQLPLVETTLQDVTQNQTQLMEQKNMAGQAGLDGKKSLVMIGTFFSVSLSKIITSMLLTSEIELSICGYIPTDNSCISLPSTFNIMEEIM